MASVFDVKSGSLVWAHAANSKQALLVARTQQAHFVEADIRSRPSDNVPVLRHDAFSLVAEATDCEFSEWLEEFNRLVQELGMQGLKLDFKDACAVQPVVSILNKFELSVPLWFNADVLSGPGGDAAAFDPDEFVCACREFSASDTAVFSLGWTTDAPTGCVQERGYTFEHTSKMLELCKRTGLCNVTFPVRLAWLPVPGSWRALVDGLLRVLPHASLTVWKGRSSQDIALFDQAHEFLLARLNEDDEAPEHERLGLRERVFCDLYGY